MSKYSALTHELTDINLCLKNLDGTPQRTNQSQQADETVHATNTIFRKMLGGIQQ